jgi:hypothetical protein
MGKNILRMSENSVLRRIFEPKEEEAQDAGEKRLMTNFI